MKMQINKDADMFFIARHFLPAFNLWYGYSIKPEITYVNDDHGITKKNKQVLYYYFI